MLPGIVVAFVVGIPLAIGAFLSGIFCAVATGYLKENSRVKEDTVMGIVFSGMFAFGWCCSRASIPTSTRPHSVRQHAGHYRRRAEAKPC